MAHRRSKKMRGGNCGAMHEGGRRRRTMRGGSGYGFAPNQVGTPIGAAAGGWERVDGTAPAPGGPHSVTEGGRRRRGSRKTRRVVKKKSVATIKRLLKAKGLKVSGSRRAVTARARKARIPLKGGAVTGTPYGGYVGTGSAGMASQFAGAHRVDNNVITTGGYGLRTTESGGAAEA
jgi:hypothetical protein